MKSILYIEDLQGLFEEVQLAALFADQKVFADSIPKHAVGEIITAYRNEKSAAGFDLFSFIHTHFQLPAYSEAVVENETTKSAEAHINSLWQILTRNATVADGSTTLPLPFNYVVPGGRFQEMFYWDSYFTMLGLQVSDNTVLMQNMVDNFAYLINEYGHIPNGTRSYFLSRSQPPFFSLMVALLAETEGDGAYTKYLPQLTAEYDFWMQGSTQLTTQNNSSKRVVLLPDGSILNRYWDEKNEPRPEGFVEDTELYKNAISKEGFYRNIRAACESGWDFSGRWFADNQNITTIQTTNIIPVDLNCLLLHLEQTLYKANSLANNTIAADYLQKATERKAAINKYLWNDETACFCDYNSATHQPLAYLTIAIAFPLFVKMASAQQASAVLHIVEDKFLKSGGLLTTLAHTGQQWDAPNGWAPLQWIGYQAAINYNNTGLAEKIKTNWTKNVERVFTATGKMMEKYNVENTTLTAGGGEYPNQDGFGWTNGVYLKMMSNE